MATAGTDWAAIKQRLAVSAAAISGGHELGPEQTLRILKARARTAAKPPAAADDAPRLEVLAFALAGETYAVELTCVREVCALRNLTAIPSTPAFLAGVMNLRGRILAIVDLRALFELPPRGLTELNQVIVLASDEDEFGLLADRVEGIRAVAVADLQQGLPTLSGVREKFLQGVTGGLLAVLDGPRLLADPDLKIKDDFAR